MFEYVSVGSLRPLGKKVELKRFDESCSDFNSIEKFFAGLMYRFFQDVHCPALFIKIPKRETNP